MDDRKTNGSALIPQGVEDLEVLVRTSREVVNMILGHFKDNRPCTPEPGMPMPCGGSLGNNPMKSGALNERLAEIAREMLAVRERLEYINSSLEYNLGELWLEGR